MAITGSESLATHLLRNIREQEEFRMGKMSSFELEVIIQAATSIVFKIRDRFKIMVSSWRSAKDKPMGYTCESSLVKFVKSGSKNENCLLWGSF